MKKTAVVLLAALAAGVLVGNVCLKNLIARPRPCWLDSSVHGNLSRKELIPYLHQ